MLTSIYGEQSLHPVSSSSRTHIHSYIKIHRKNFINSIDVCFIFCHVYSYKWNIEFHHDRRGQSTYHTGGEPVHGRQTWGHHSRQSILHPYLYHLRGKSRRSLYKTDIISLSCKYIIIYIIKWNFLYDYMYVCTSVCMYVPKYLEKYRTYSVKTNT